MIVGPLRILGWLLPLSLAQAAIIALTVWIALRLLPLDRARLRHSIAMSALATMVVAFFTTAGIFMADWNDHVACWTSGAHPITAECRAHGVPSEPGVEPVAKASGVFGSSRLRLISSLPADGAVALSWTNLAVTPGAAWLGIALILAMREIRLRRRISSVRRSSSPVTDGNVQRALVELRRYLAIDARVEIRESGLLGTPCVIGGDPGTILFPIGLRSVLDDGMIRGIIAHELAHVRRRDSRAIWVERIAGVALFFNPFTAWVARRAREERETDCDQIGAECGTGSRADYARALLLLEGFRTGPMLAGNAAALLGAGQLATRVERLLAQPRPTRLFSRAAAIVALSVLLLSAALVVTTAAGAALGSWAVMAADEQYANAGEVD